MPSNPCATCSCRRHGRGKSPRGAAPSSRRAYASTRSPRGARERSLATSGRLSLRDGLLREYRRLKDKIGAVVAAPDFKSLLKAYNAFKGEFLSKERGDWDSLADLTLARCVVELEALVQAQAVSGLDVSGAFALFMRGLESKQYVGAGISAGVPVYEWRVAAGVCPDRHFVLHASQDALSVPSRGFDYLGEAVRDELRAVSGAPPDAAPAFIRAYALSGASVSFTCPDAGLGGAEAAHGFLVSMSIEDTPKAKSDRSYATEAAWLAGRGDRPAKLHRIQSLGLAAAAAAPAFSPSDGARLAPEPAALAAARLSKRRRSPADPAAVDARSAIDATAINAYFACPYAYLYVRLLDAAPQASGISFVDALFIGDVYHHALARLFERIRETDGRFEPDRAGEYRDLVGSCLGDAFDELARKRGPFVGVVLEAYRGRLKSHLENLVDAEVSLFPGLAIGPLEEEFELDYPSLEGGVVLRGRVDRISLSEKGAVVVDYKKGHVPSKAQVAPNEDGGIAAAQIPCYLRLVTANGGVVDSAWYVSIEGDARREAGSAVCAFGDDAETAARPVRRDGPYVPRSSLQAFLDSFDSALRDHGGHIRRGLPPRLQGDAEARLRELRGQRHLPRALCPALRRGTMSSERAYKLAEDLEGAQREAATLAGNLVVAAGAGSGKTTVLAARYVRLLATGRMPGILPAGERVHARNVLVLTFTRKAAAEMYSRIYGALAAAAARADDPRLAGHLASCLADFSQAQISTFDSFAARVARSGSSRFGIAPDFAVDEERAARMASDLALSFILEHREEEAMRELVASAGLEGVRDEVLAPLALRRMWISSPPDFAAFHGLQTFRLEEMAAAAKERILSMRAAALDYSGSRTTATSKAWLDALEAESEDAKGDESKKPSSRSSIASRGSASLRPILATKLLCSSRISVPGFRDSADRYRDIAATRASHPGRLDLYRLLDAFREKWDQVRRAEKPLTFRDVAQLACDVLETDPDVLGHYRDLFRYVMIDEFQDDDELQKRVLFLLAGREGEGSEAERSEASRREPLRQSSEAGNRASRGQAFSLAEDKLFFVGDEKQSIYLFRGADVSVFRRLAGELSARSGPAPGDAETPETGIATGKPISLVRNFRSEPGVIDMINQIFPSVMAPLDPDKGPEDFEARFEPLQSRAATPGVDHDSCTSNCPAGARRPPSPSATPTRPRLGKWRESCATRSSAAVLTWRTGLPASRGGRATRTSPSSSDRPAIRCISRNISASSTSPTAPRTPAAFSPRPSPAICTTPSGSPSTPGTATPSRPIFDRPSRGSRTMPSSAFSRRPPRRTSSRPRPGRSSVSATGRAGSAAPKLSALSRPWPTGRLSAHACPSCGSRPDTAPPSYSTPWPRPSRSTSSSSIPWPSGPMRAASACPLSWPSSSPSSASRTSSRSSSRGRALAACGS